MEVSMKVPCRKCDKCLLFRRMRWRQRIINELLMCDDGGRRSWFVTLTFAPVHLAGVILESAEAIAGGVPRRKAVEASAYKHVQAWLKRVRKQSRARFRYVAVPEYGEEKGRLHYHLVLHEVKGLVLYQHLKSQWKSRVFEAKLVEMHSDRGPLGLSRYLVKYLTKDGGRPRPSLRYGEPPKKAAPPAIRF